MSDMEWASSRPRKVYLSDGAYAEFNGESIILTTENGLRETNRVVLDTEGLNVLLTFVSELRGK